MMTNVTSLSQARAKRGLPPAPVDLAKPALERVLERYRAMAPFTDPKIKLDLRFRQLCHSCAKQMVRMIEDGGELQVDDEARFQFFGVGGIGEERLQARVNRVGRSSGRLAALYFEIDPQTCMAQPLEQIAAAIKPLLTLPMTGFYRLR